jgi:hypothetical protein
VYSVVESAPEWASDSDGLSNPGIEHDLPRAGPKPGKRPLD